MNKYNILIVGGGIGGLAMAHEISSNLLGHKDLKIGLIESKQLQKCSTRTTSVVSLHGIKSGISPLGDDLVKSYELFKSFVKKTNYNSVQHCIRSHIALNEMEEEKLKSRFDRVDDIKFQNLSYKGIEEEAFVVEANSFLKEMRDQAHKNGVEFLEDTILEIKEKDRVELVGLKESYHTNILILATGAFSKLMPIVDSTKDFYGSVVPGHYYEWDYDFDHSFVVSLEGHNLIYRKQDGKLILGGSTQKDGVAYPAHDQLNNQYEKFQEVFEMPDLCDAKLLTGLRQKGVKRRPFIGEISSRIFALTSLYKNGFTLSFLGAKRVRSFIDTHLESF